MQFSLAAGSDRAVGTQGAGVGLGSGRGGCGQHPGVRRLWDPGAGGKPGLQGVRGQTRQGWGWYFPKGELLTGFCRRPHLEPSQEVGRWGADTLLPCPVWAFWDGATPSLVCKDTRMPLGVNVLFFFGCATWLEGSWFSNQRWKPGSGQ